MQFNTVVVVNQMIAPLLSVSQSVCVSLGAYLQPHSVLLIMINYFAYFPTVKSLVGRISMTRRFLRRSSKQFTTTHAQLEKMFEERSSGARRKVGLTSTFRRAPDDRQIFNQ